ncbi:MAG: FtsW/RodA/SpoVE family cell cycle protein [Clostridiales bacterium]|nr:FtsW/RodA/SpoVE family cell cycle protein [Clostridiales bacterium]
MNRLLGRVADFIRETDKLLFLLCIFSSGYGCVAVLSATHPSGSLRRFFMQVVALFLGGIAAAVISSIDYKTIAKFWPLITGGSLALVALTFFFGYAPEGTDDKAWLLLPGGLSLQPAELLKIAFAITFGLHVSHVKEEINKPLQLLLLCLHGAVPVVLIHLQGDDGTAMVFAFMFICMLFAAGVKLRYFAIAGVLVLVSLPLLWFFVMNSDQQARIISLLNPEDDLLGDGWQQWRGRVALASGGLFGKGLFKGPHVQSESVPEGYNDFIIASIGEELGLIGVLAVLALLAAICIRILRISHDAQDTLGSIMCVGIFAMLAAQTIINLGMCFSMLPVVGVTLPFFSAGGTSLACLFLGIGLALSVYMHRNSRTIYLREL